VFQLKLKYFVKGLDPEVEKIIRDAIKKAQAQGAKIEEISLPNAEFALACYYIIVPCEAQQTWRASTA
jgi:aspartyl-tRNA(Asn)/glutamyl-tRNA(Gln) amidotransferase subunit A